MISPIKNPTNILYYLIIWALIICAHFFILFKVFQLPLYESLLDCILFNAMFCALGIGLWFTVRYFNVENKSFFTILLNHLSASIILSTIWILISYIILRILNNSEQYLYFLNNSIPWRYLIGFFYYIIIILSYYVVLFYTQYQEKKIREATLVIERQESELRRLRSQIHPHFIFNTLNSISSLTLIAPEKAQEMVIKLSDFLRYSLKHDTYKKVTFKEELDNIKLYLDIEKTRFGERFNYMEEIESGCYEKLIPDMILQPLFENALKHGVYESLDTVSIQLNCSCDTGYLKISLKNSFSKELKEKKGTGTGLANIQNRLRLTYGRNDLLKIIKDEAHYEVLLSIPQN